MKRHNSWLYEVSGTVTKTKHFLANISVSVKTDQYRLFKKGLSPSKKTKVLDVGVSSEEIFKDSNMFEKLYEWPENITAATIEDGKKLKKLYPRVKTVRISPGKGLPFRDKQFDMVVSWATLEHVGSYGKQRDFIDELLRVGKKVFITTPYRGCVYEPHTGFFFLHWLPLSRFRKLCIVLNQKFWSTSENLNPLWANDLAKMKLRRKITIRIYRLFNLLPSHLIIRA